MNDYYILSESKQPLVSVTENREVIKSRIDLRIKGTAVPVIGPMSEFKKTLTREISINTHFGSIQFNLPSAIPYHAVVMEMRGESESGKSVFYITLTTRSDKHCDPTFYPLGTRTTRYVVTVNSTTYKLHRQAIVYIINYYCHLLFVTELPKGSGFVRMKSQDGSPVTVTVTISYNNK